MSHYSWGSDGVGEGGEGGDNYVVPDHDRPENQQLHKVDDRFLKRYSIQRRKDVGNFIFAKNTSPWTALIKQDRQNELTPLNIMSAHVRNGQLSWTPNGRRETPRDWQIMPELPDSKELLDKDPPPLPLNNEKPASKHEYLGTQYRLYRCEGTELLRRGIASYRNNFKSLATDAFVYTQVHVQGMFFTKLGAAFRISFSTEMSETKVVWEGSDRLTPGTLVALSTPEDKFQTICHVAVVAARPLLGGLIPDKTKGEGENTPPRVDVFWANPDTAVIDPSEEMVMIEAQGGYFETVRHAMVGLQHAALHDSKFDKYLINGSQIDDNADYVKELRPEAPPAAATFDQSQLNAFNRMTSKELAIVQGPPGTGKTFTSVVAVESLIKAFGKYDEPLPIIVSAQTNHALDQLLIECIKNDARVLRLGGRTQNEEIEKRSMYNLRQEWRGPRSEAQADGSRKRVFHRFKELLQICFPTRLISAETFLAEGVISEKQFESLNTRDWDDVDDTQSGTSSDEGLINIWLGDKIERDTTYVYIPPAGQAGPVRATPVGTPGMEAEASAIREDRRQFDDDEKDRLHGQFLPTKFHWTGVVKSKGKRWVSKAAQLLREQHDLYQVEPEYRGMVYRYLRYQLMAKATKDLPSLLREYQKTCDNIKIKRGEDNVKMIKHKRIQVVGCTTTGLTKYRCLLAALKPKVLMIEEAAETREPNITSAIFPTLDQIILVGDHQQLVPHVDVRELGFEPYKLNVSLFERLVTGTGLPYCQLQVQRRMIPAIREVVQTFYPSLRDHETVEDTKNRPPVPGIGHNLWWFQHDWPDSRNERFSFVNMEEASMIVGFAQYLAQNGIEPSQMTILSFYSGQVELITSLLRNNKWFLIYHPGQDWTRVVRTVDGFQGEQNDVVLLSVVRSSPDKPNAGFVENENRAVVALSRAKRGLYVFGNDDNLLDSSNRSRETWEKVCNVFLRSRGKTLPVVCKNHGKITEIQGPDGWLGVSGGGCQNVCEKTCQNGHPCGIPCHPTPQSQICCQRPCQKILTCGHGCTSCCGEACKCPHRCDEPKLKSPISHNLSINPKTSARNTASGSKPRALWPKNAVRQRPFPAHVSSEELMSLLQDQPVEAKTNARRAGQDPKPSQTGQPAQAPGAMVIRETFKRAVMTSQGRIVDYVSYHTHESRADADTDGDLIDLRDEVLIRSGPGGEASSSSKPLEKKIASSELLIDFDE